MLTKKWYKKNFSLLKKGETFWFDKSDNMDISTKKQQQQKLKKRLKKTSFCFFNEKDQAKKKKIN